MPGSCDRLLRRKHSAGWLGRSNSKVASLHCPHSVQAFAQWEQALVLVKSSAHEGTVVADSSASKIKQASLDALSLPEVLKAPAQHRSQLQGARACELHAASNSEVSQS